MAAIVSVPPWPPHVPTNPETSADPAEDGDVDGGDEVEGDEVGTDGLDVGATELDGKSVAELDAADDVVPGLPKPVVVLLQAVTATSSRTGRRAVCQRGPCDMARG